MEVGQYLIGNCTSYFGQNSGNELKRIEAIGPNWVVAKDINTNEILLAKGSNIEESLEKFKCSICPNCNGSGIINKKVFDKL